MYSHLAFVCNNMVKEDSKIMSFGFAISKFYEIWETYIKSLTIYTRWFLEDMFTA